MTATWGLIIDVARCHDCNNCFLACKDEFGRLRVGGAVGVGPDREQRVEALIKADDRILADPAPIIAVSELADSSVNFVVRPWVKVEDYWGVYFDLTEKIKKSFDDNGISIPYPQRDVHVYKHGDDA